MSSSYNSLDWGLSHWAHFTVRRFIHFVFFSYVADVAGKKLSCVSV